MRSHYELTVDKTAADILPHFGHIHQIDHDLDHLDHLYLTCRYEMCGICIVQIQPRKHVLDHAGYTASTRQHELDHTDHTDHTDQEPICPEISKK